MSGYGLVAKRPWRCASLATWVLLVFVLFCAVLTPNSFASEPAEAASDHSATALEDAPSAVLQRTAADGRHATAGQYTTADLSPERMEAARRKARVEAEVERNTACETGALRGRECRVSWPRVLGQSVMFLAAQHGGNIWQDKDTRYNLTHGPFWGDYITCVKSYRWSRWKDDDPFSVDYVGHPMMGALTNSIYEQNDPKQRALTFENSRRYWMGRLRATAYSAAYSAQWKVGPLSEASIGNTGLGYYVRDSDQLLTNETGMQDFFVTPIGGLAWNVGEDVVDRYVLARVRRHTRNKALLVVSGVLTPGKSAANLSRFRAVYYRDLDRSSAPR